MTQICKAKSPYSNGKIKFSNILATSYPRVFISKDTSVTWEFSCSSVWPVTHKEKHSTFFPSALTEPMDFPSQPSGLEKYCSVFRPRSHIFFQSLQSLPEITFTVAHCLPFRKAFPCVRESLVPWSWGRHLPHSKLPGVYQVLIFYLITIDFGQWKPRGQRPPCPGSSSTLRTCSQNCFSQWNFKYGTALTLGIETPGSFPLRYEKFIIFAISQILIVTRCCDERQNVLQAQT